LEFTVVPPLLEAISEFGHPKFDPCLDGPERLVQPRGNLGMSETFVVCEFNRLLLRLGQSSHSCPDRNTQVLVGLRLKRARTGVGHLSSGSGFQRARGPIA
jgi:hypothetical protein